MLLNLINTKHKFRETKMFKTIAGILITSVCLLSSALGEENKILFPQDYRTTFYNYVSNDRVMNPDQTIRIFANDIAIQGPAEDGKLQYGSILVAEVYKAKKDKDGNVIVSSLNRRIRSDIALIAVMQRKKGFSDNLPEGLKNEDWDFAAFKPDGAVADKDLNECRACHAPLTETNHLFSYEHFIK